jgi:hypothetical protein
VIARTPRAFAVAIMAFSENAARARLSAVPTLFSPGPEGACYASQHVEREAVIRWSQVRVLAGPLEKSP